ncbi:hypothetical protein H9P43_006751 [Blastocladiella emersonii ATCC 22665]|nr:hypothetical protein H9P43_006751 [Blastocladiella emersonii ATCC 22665]
MFRTYAVLLREDMPDDEAARVFFKVADPNWNRRWVERWLNLKPRSAGAIHEYYREFVALLGEVTTVTPAVEREHQVKRVFTSNIYHSLRWKSDALHDHLFERRPEIAEFLKQSRDVLATLLRLPSGLQSRAIREVWKEQVDALREMLQPPKPAVAPSEDPDAPLCAEREVQTEPLEETFALEALKITVKDLEAEVALLPILMGVNLHSHSG